MTVNTVTQYDSIHVSQEEIDFLKDLTKIVDQIDNFTSREYEEIFIELVNSILEADPNYDIGLSDLYYNN